MAGETKASTPDIRVLGVQIDAKVKWRPHIKTIHEKMVTQTRSQRFSVYARTM